MAQSRDLNKLWAEAAAGDQAAFGLLFDELSSQIYRFARHRLSSDTEADDVVAEAFLQLWRRRNERPPDEVTIRAWTFGIAANLVRRRWRSVARGDRAMSRVSARAHIDQAAVDSERDLVDSIEASEQIMHLRVALDRLPPPMADILVMRAWDEMDYNEIAYVLDCPVGTVRSRLSRARTRLRAEFEKIETEPNSSNGNVIDVSPRTVRHR